jgi:hypothetical protein
MLEKDFKNPNAPPSLESSIYNYCSLKKLINSSSLETYLDVRRLLSNYSSLACLSSKKASSTPRKYEKLNFNPSFGGN